MQNQSEPIDCKIELDVAGTTPHPTVKRVQPPASFAELKQQAQKFAAKHGIKSSISQIKYQEYPGSETYVTVEDDDDLELGMAMIMSANDATARTITFLVQFGKDLPSLEDSEESKETQETETKPIDTCTEHESLLDNSNCEPSKNFMKLVDHETELLQINAREIFSELCKNTKIGAMFEDEKKVKAKHPLAGEFEKVAEEVFKDLLYSKDIEEEQDEDQMSILEMAQLQVVHTGIKCDGCSVMPIRGIRYKCSVRKNYDLCSQCEERLGDEYSFLKIREAGTAPEVMVTILPDDGKEPEPAEDPLAASISGFLSKMGVNKEEMVDQYQKQKQEFDKEGKSWNQLRAVLQKKPEGVIEASPGQTVFGEIEILNDTFWPWKQGCSLTLHDEQDFAGLPIDVVHVPITEEVKGKQSIKITVPFSVLPNVVADESKVWDINLTIRGPRGHPFGDEIPAQLKICFPKAPKDEIEIYKLAIKLQELKLGTFEQCTKAAIASNCDEASAIKSLQQEQPKLENTAQEE